MSFTYLQTDDYVWKLLEILVQQPNKELHLYAVHSVENPILAEEDEIEDIYRECAFDGVFDRDGDRVGEEESDAFNLHADKEDGEDNIFEFIGDGEEDDNEVDGDDEVVEEEALVLSDFEGSADEE